MNIRSRTDKSRHIYLKFDIKDLGSANIESVVLEMTNAQWTQEPPEGAKTGGDESAVVVSLDPESWDQETLTFLSAPPFDEVNNKIGEYIQEGPMGYLERVKIDIDPSYIKGNGLYSFALIGTVGEDDSNFFATRNEEFGEEYGPALVITYTAGGNTLYIILGVIAVIVIAGAAFFAMKKKA